MVEGRVEKFYKEVCLLEQPFVKNPDVTIEQMITEKVAKIGEKISVRRFVRYKLGEGLEKRVDDLAAEVAAQTAAMQKYFLCAWYGFGLDRQSRAVCAKKKGLARSRCWAAGLPEFTSAPILTALPFKIGLFLYNQCIWCGGHQASGKNGGKTMAKYRRIVLKLSGESLAAGHGAFDEARILEVAKNIAALSQMGVEPAVVMGGGNIWRGRFSERMDPVSADQMGMLATVINALAVQEALRRVGQSASVFTAQEMNRFAALYTRDAADAALRAGEVALLAGGTGNPFFTTDTGAALRAAELKADAVFKGTTVDGVYDADPHKNPDARLIREISYREAIERGLKVMDISAFTLCMERHVPEIRVFSMNPLSNILRVAEGEALGTVAHE